MLKRIFLLALAALAGWMVWRWLRQRQDEFGAMAPQLSPISPAGMTPPAYESPSWSAAPPPDRMAADVAEEAEAAWHGLEAAPGEATDVSEDTRAAEVAQMDELLPEPATQQAEPSPQVVGPGELEEGGSTPSAAESAPLEHEPSAEPAEPAASAAAAAAPESETTEAPSAPEQPAAEVHAAPGDREGAPASADATTSAEHSPAAEIEDTGEAEVHVAPGDGEDAPASADAATSAEHSPVAELEDTGEVEGIVGYCVRCKTKRAIMDAHEETTESGRRAARGTCPVCGANMFTFLPSEE